MNISVRRSINITGSATSVLGKRSCSKSNVTKCALGKGKSRITHRVDKVAEVEFTAHQLTLELGVDQHRNGLILVERKGFLCRDTRSHQAHISAASKQRTTRSVSLNLATCSRM